MSLAPTAVSRPIPVEPSASSFAGACAFVTRDPRTLDQLDLARQVADTSATVLITGESGVGKELIAQAIRDGSGPRSHPFVPVNCAAIPESLQESEFFGHVKGAFTGASERKIGKLERATGGTIFLDEISEMSPSLQAALLRTLQSGEYSPVGSSETRTCDVRVIAASNRDLKQMVDEGGFRQDLYYRLNIIRLEIPALRERKTDIPLLVEHFAGLLGVQYGGCSLSVGDEAMRALIRHDYPGNVRELENAMRRAAILAKGGAIELKHLPEEIAGSQTSAPEAEDLGGFQEAKAAAVEKFERNYLTQALVQSGGIVSRASARSGLSERNFHEKLKRYGISAKSFRAQV